MALSEITKVKGEGCRREIPDKVSLRVYSVAKNMTPESKKTRLVSLKLKKVPSLDFRK